jgi:hypothetical protein
MTLGRYLLIVVMAFAILVAMPVACYGQKDSTRVVRVSRLTEVYGLTVCFEGKGYSFISTHSIPLNEVQATVVHEAMHREQYERFASCRDFDKWYETPKGMVETEAEAYAAGYCAIKGGEDPIELFQSYVNRIERLVGTINRLEIVTTLHRYTKNCAYPGTPQ